MLEQGDECVQHAGRQLDSLPQLTVRRGGFDHPQRELQGLPIGLAHGLMIAGQMWPTRPGDDLETAAMERVEWIVNRHRGRHGIQCGCRSTSICIAMLSSNPRIAQLSGFSLHSPPEWCNRGSARAAEPVSGSPSNAFAATPRCSPAQHSRTNASRSMTADAPQPRCASPPASLGPHRLPDMPS